MKPIGPPHITYVFLTGPLVAEAIKQPWFNKEVICNIVRTSTTPELTGCWIPKNRAEELDKLNETKTE